MFDERDLERVVTPELERGEKLLWAGKPGLRGIRSPSAVAFGVGVLWTCFTVNFIYMWHNDGPKLGDGPGGLFGMQGILADVFFVPFILVGFAAILSPIWFYLDAKRTVYGVTDKRVIIVRTGRSRKVQTFGAADLGDLERTERPDGSGDLAFARRHWRDSDGHQQSLATKFVAIPDVRHVEKLLRDLAGTAPDRS